MGNKACKCFQRPKEASRHEMGIILQEAKRVIVLDFDGPVNDHIYPLSDELPKCEFMHGQVYETDAYSSAENVMGWRAVVSNFGLLEACLEVVTSKSGVRVLPGSQRCAMYSTNIEKLTTQSYYEMYAAVDALWGKERYFYLKADGDALASGIHDAHELDDSKLALLQNVGLIGGCEKTSKDNVCLVDDNICYQDGAVSNGYHFIHCERSMDKDVDSHYLADMLRWALQEHDDQISKRILKCDIKLKDELLRVLKLTAERQHTLKF